MSTATMTNKMSMTTLTMMKVPMANDPGTGAGTAWVAMERGAAAQSLVSGSLSLAALTRRLADAVGERELTVRLLLCAALLLVLATTTTLALMATAPQWVLGEPGLINLGSARVLQALVGLVLWLSLMGLCGAAWGTGAFDQLLRSRAAQAACIVTIVSAAVWLGGSVGMPGVSA